MVDGTLTKILTTDHINIADYRLITTNNNTNNEENEIDIIKKERGGETNQVNINDVYNAIREGNLTTNKKIVIVV